MQNPRTHSLTPFIIRTSPIWSGPRVQWQRGTALAAICSAPGGVDATAVAAAVPHCCHHPGERMNVPETHDPVGGGEGGEEALLSPKTISSLTPDRPSRLGTPTRQAIYIGLSFVFSAAINLYNTYLFSRERYNLGLPLFAAAIYDWTQLALGVLLVFLTEYRSGPGVCGSFRMLSRRQFVRFVLPCGVAAALNVGLSNSSLRYVSLSFYTMVKSCAPVFVLLFAFAFRLEQPNATLLQIILLIGVGVVLTVWDAFSFSLWGFLLVFGATVMSGFRWTLTQLIIESGTSEDIDEETELAGSGPLRTMLFLAPVIGSTLFILSMLVEGPRTVAHSVFFASWDSGLRSFGVCLVGGLQAFILILLEYKVVQETSVLTFSLSGIIKELLTIGLSVWIFGDRIKPINMVGATISIAGLLCYNLYRIQSKRTKSCATHQEEMRRRRRTEAAMQNIFIALPTTEPAWMLDHYLIESGESLMMGGREEAHHLCFLAPKPSPVEHVPRSRDGRHSSYGEETISGPRPVEAPGGSLRSSRNGSPTRKLGHGATSHAVASPIELRHL